MSELYSNHEMLLEMNNSIHRDAITLTYHMNHIRLTKEYALALKKKLDAQISDDELGFIALAHDILKERGLHPETTEPIGWEGHSIPQDLNRYVRMNLGVLEEFHLEDFFNTDIQLHALAAGIFLRKEFDITDEKILYPIFFHSCPIIEVYETLSKDIQELVDLVMLADKLSSNYLRINERHHLVRVDLDQSVFGESGKEFNFSLGLYMARLISQGKNPDNQSIIATKYYYNRLKSMNPLIGKEGGIKKLGGNKVWPQRRSKILETQ